MVKLEGLWRIARKGCTRCFTRIGKKSGKIWSLICGEDLYHATFVFGGVKGTPNAPVSCQVKDGQDDARCDEYSDGVVSNRCPVD